MLTFAPSTMAKTTRDLLERWWINAKDDADVQRAYYGAPDDDSVRIQQLQMAIPKRPSSTQTEHREMGSTEGWISRRCSSFPITSSISHRGRRWKIHVDLVVRLLLSCTPNSFRKASPVNAQSLMSEGFSRNLLSFEVSPTLTSHNFTNQQ